MPDRRKTKQFDKIDKSNFLRNYLTQRAAAYFENDQFQKLCKSFKLFAENYSEAINEGGSE